MTETIRALREIADRFDHVLLDQWGALHEGKALFPEAKDCVLALHAAGKRVLVLSNSGKRAEDNLQRLVKMGLPAEIYDGVLSSGEQTRLALAKALLNRPRLLLLDEPTASIDPSTARDIRAGVSELVDTGDCGVLWTSHNMYEVEAVCDRVLFVSRGRILLEGDPKQLPHQHGAASLDDLFVAVAHEGLHNGAQGHVQAAGTRA